MVTTQTETVIIGAILDAMNRKKVTQLELAKYLNIGRTTLCSKFTHRRFTAKEIFKMCDYLGIQIVVIGDKT